VSDDVKFLNCLEWGQFFAIAVRNSAASADTNDSTLYHFMVTDKIISLTSTIGNFAGFTACYRYILTYIKSSKVITVLKVQDLSFVGEIKVSYGSISSI
jgi:hypothetical protein